MNIIQCQQIDIYLFNQVNLFLLFLNLFKIFSNKNHHTTLYNLSYKSLPKPLNLEDYLEKTDYNRLK